MRHWRTLVALAVVGTVAGGVVALSSAESAATTFPVNGTFILWDDFPALAAGELCDAKRSLYHDINRDTPVRAETRDGTELTRTTLGDGRIIAAPDLAALIDRTTDSEVAELEGLMAEAGLQPCLFEFRLDVESGSDNGQGYVILLGRRGRFELSEERLMEPGALQLSVGLR